MGHSHNGIALTDANLANFVELGALGDALERLVHVHNA